METTEETIHDMNESKGSDAVDMTKVKVVEKSTLDPLEKEERSAAKKHAKKAEKGAWIVAVHEKSSLKCDGKVYKRGDVFDGKMYDGIQKSLMSKDAWEKR